jgi:2-oxoglutarate dehydrogenase E2 component (dihydrolipoamide succinyltransferase)
MPTDVIMPQMGESIIEGTITKWLKKPGDNVEKDEPLFEISTDKVDAEIPAPEAGVLAEIRCPVGMTVEINTVVAIIAEPGTVIVPAAAGTVDTQGAGAQAFSEHSPAQEQSAAPQVPLRAPGERIVATPLARKIAKERGLDLSRIAGSGTSGRIHKEDVLRALSQPTAAASEAAPPQVASLPFEPVPLTRMRSIIAERMVESVRIAPHVHTVYKIDMTRVARLREQRKEAFAGRHGVKLTYMPFIARATVEALRQFPIVNASLEGTAPDLAIRYHRTIDLGIAVALDWGLIVPVVRHAEQKSFVELARTIADLAARARTKKLSPDEVGGSTFTLTNAGAFGGEFGLPIINQPESAILAVGGLRKEPAIITDADGNDSIAIHSTQYFCLGFDHRLIDGADGGKFMLEFQRVLENWSEEIG